MAANSFSKKSAFRLVILLGVVSLLADMTYEGARSITGPYLAVLGASATVVGIVAGFGEFIGYGLRLIFGYLSDRTGRYWLMTLSGYAINLLAVPLLALAGRWEIAAALIIAERMGKAIRTPSRDAMLSHATKQVGHGWGFGIHEAMDQVGAMLGPLIVAVVLYLKGGYKTSFGVLLIPAILALIVLAAARFLYPRPRELEVDLPVPGKGNIKGAFWMYLAAVALIAAGYADFPLIAYHFKKVATVPDNWIPIFYAVAMGVDALAALLFGRIFDRLGISVLIGAASISAFSAPLVFTSSFSLALSGVITWGIGMGAQESVMRAAIAGMTPPTKRATAYGIFNAAYGLSWFLGSALMGILYDISIGVLIMFSMLVQLISIPFFVLSKRQLLKA